ncbi:DJ-1/PfpI family protein [Rhizobiaceae bacterium BDR2-2]|uniref:DJ-1/PfpI family protein n=1 Tax=Ectorhizobium quercum TaxID=2965071 RepID=A0AAE3MV83_9HYPH|nr:DJ-1/PfpI family protein [Ectorhizobium quercum]MCX8995548.1 DJ-1/PfpI family protein [Ectorhizobium quercum]
MTAASDPLAERFEAGRTIKVGILLFPEVEVLDFAGPFEVFSVASRVAQRNPDRNAPAFDVSTVAARRENVIARHGLTVEPRHGFAEAPPFDLFVVPGGVVTQPLNDAGTLAYVRAASGQALLTASVCTGAFVLARIGLLDGRRATTHWEDIPDLRTAFPAVAVIDDVPYIDEGAIVTSAGISAGIGMSLHLVARIGGEALARATARQMQFDWEPAPLPGS